MNELVTAIQALSAGFSFFAQNKDDLLAILSLLDGIAHHDNIDIAQDALDACQAGHLTADQTKRIIEICLEPKTTKIWQEQYRRGNCSLEELAHLSELDKIRSSPFYR